ncbi:MAG: hypothetical protein HFE83_06585 [Lachnospiraceae bacterium]|jgi:hypothetical protein|nr:hypothetical protein [Lachnospiraceae bacterium]
MRKHVYKIVSALCTSFLLMQAACLPVWAAARQREVDTLTLETEEAAEEDIAVDLGWKTEQDKGRWIEEMGIAGDCKSLVLVINNLNKKPEDAVNMALADAEGKERPRRRDVAGNSRLYYLNKDENGDWNQVFAINCIISGGPEEDETIYGAYRLESAFGSLDNPGSLTPYHSLSERDYWIMDPQSEHYMTIFRAGTSGLKTEKTELAVRLEEMRAYSNYGMILRAEGGGGPSLIINCQQADTVDRTFGGIQLSESYVRMLIQSIDQETRIMIAGDVEDLEGM